jgi:hypothetical protein
MANYMYDLGAVSANNQAYLLEHRVAAARAVTQLLAAGA